MKRMFFILVTLNVNLQLYGQTTQTDVSSGPVKVSGNLQITNNGVSLFPNLSLGKPAAIININLVKKNFSLEPELRWGLNGDPWSFIFWLRYRLTRSKFQLRTGIHPSYVFADQQVYLSGQAANRIIATRYFAAEAAPSYQWSSHFGLSVHYLHARALDDYGAAFCNFFAVQPRFTSMKIRGPVYLNFFPQVFFLQLAQHKGYYMSETLTINHAKSPVYLSSLVTYKISSTIPGDKWVTSFGLNIKF